MNKVISIVLLSGAVINALIDGFNTANVIFIVLSGLLLLFCLFFRKPGNSTETADAAAVAPAAAISAATAGGMKKWRMVNAGAFAIYIVCILLLSRIFSPADIYSFSRETNKAAYLIASGDFKQAEKLLLKQLEKDSSDSAANLNLAVVYLKKHNADLAKRHLELASYGLYFDENLWYNFGLVYYQNKDYQKARDSFEKAVQLNPGFVKANIYAGTMNYILGDMRRSLYNLQNAEFIAPESPEIMLHMGRACTGLMEFDTAIEYFNRALELKPGKELEKAIREQLAIAEAARGGAVQ